MKTARGRTTRASDGPVPAQAGASFLVHDLKNLAGRLSALYQNLDLRYDDPLFKSTALELLDDTVVHLKRLAVDLKDHESRVLIKLRIDLNHVLEEATKDTRPDLVGKVELWEEYEPLPVIWGDAYLLRRAFACAIENALEALQGQGILSLRTREVRRNRRTRLQVEIMDNGPGMSPEFVREFVARPFASTKEEGLGLGVYTMRQVASMHGGTVRIMSQKGVGTRVRFHFPVEGR